MRTSPLLCAAAIFAAGYASLAPHDARAIAATDGGLDAADDLVQLDHFEVAGLPLDDSINPLVRATEGLFGDMRGPLDTPRAASTVTQALLRERGIGGVREFTVYAPGATAHSSYGKLASPRIRGDNAETFVNGQRIGYNRFGVFPSFNGVESLDVVRAPGSAIYGSGFMTGGYVNYVTKRPQFTPQTTLTLRVGTWVPGGGAGSASWLNGSWQIDTTAPTPSGRSAWRISYEGKYDKTFFRRAGPGARDDRQDLFLAWTQNPARADGALTLDANLQVLWQAAPQLLGVNRPSQELIDHGLYYGGTIPDLGINPATGAIAGTLPNQTPVRLRRDATLLSAEDFSNAVLVRAQLIATSRPSASRKFVNRTLSEFVNRRRYHADEYAEYVEQLMIENRSEWHTQFDTAGLAHALIAGGTLRYEENKSYKNYFNEYLFQYDLSVAPGPEGQSYSHPRDYPSSYLEGYVGPGGRLFFPASLGNPETGHSKLWNPALFVQDDVHLTDSLALLAGLRLDGFLAEARDLLDDAVGTDWHDKHSSSELSWNASLRHKPHRLNERATFYATYQRAYAISGNSGGGGIMLKADPSDSTRGVIEASDFTNLSQLAELGAKFALRDNALYLGLALFDQRRSQLERGGRLQKRKARGAEVELVYQPHARLSSTLNLALTDARFDNSSASQSGGASIYNIYETGAGPSGLGNGRGFSRDRMPPADYRLPGHSRLVVNASSAYQLRSGFGAGFSASWQSEQPGNLRREYHIPEQVFLDLFLFYRGPKWSVNLDVINALDRKNWTHNGDTFSSNMLIWQELPLRFEGYLKRKF